MDNYLVLRNNPKMGTVVVTYKSVHGMFRVILPVVSIEKIDSGNILFNNGRGWAKFNYNDCEHLCIQKVIINELNVPGSIVPFTFFVHDDGSFYGISNFVGSSSSQSPNDDEVVIEASDSITSMFTKAYPIEYSKYYTYESDLFSPKLKITNESPFGLSVNKFFACKVEADIDMSPEDIFKRDFRLQIEKIKTKAKSVFKKLTFRKLIENSNSLLKI